MRLSFFHSIRFKLFLVGLTLIIVPWSGFHLISEMENILKAQQRDALISHAKTIQNVLLYSDVKFRQNRKHDLFEHNWPIPIQIDGFDSEWGLLEKHDLKISDPLSDFSFSVAVGRYQEDFSMLLNVTTQPKPYYDDRDYVVVSTGNERYQFTLGWPGVSQPKIWSESEQQFIRSYNTAGMTAAWQPTETGYALEVKWPSYKVGLDFGVRVHTIGNRKLRNVEPIEAGRLIKRLPEFEDFTERFALGKMRIRIFDWQGWRLADVNRIPGNDGDEGEYPHFAQEMLRYVLRGEYIKLYPFDDSSYRMRFQDADFSQGNGHTFQRYVSPLQHKVIATVAVPLYRKVGDTQAMIGTIFVEQSTDDILYLQDKAMQRIVLITFGVFLVTGGLLLLFAIFLTTKVSRLRKQVIKSVSHDGRIIDLFKPSKSKDELGELSRSVSNVLNRLNEYNDYLEAMASRLAHELRTPLSVVKTSIENARLNVPDSESKYLDRAYEGAERLDDILQRLREASRLENSLKDTEIVSFSVVELVKHQIEGFKEVWPTVGFDLDVVGQPESIIGAPEIVVQALEKLISNAVDFHREGTLIIIKVEMSKEHIAVSVLNEGPLLPDEDIFASMVSGRKSSSSQPHLGLGLYIVRLVADYHRGYAFASNVANDGVEVGFTIKK